LQSFSAHSTLFTSAFFLVAVGGTLEPVNPDIESIAFEDFVNVLGLPLASVTPSPKSWDFTKICTNETIWVTLRPSTPFMKLSFTDALSENQAVNASPHEWRRACSGCSVLPLAT
jgi:hypothetical protein